MANFQEFLRTVWQFLREACGEKDYARYRARILALGGRPLTTEAFYLRQLQHKYSQPSRCC